VRAAPVIALAALAAACHSGGNITLADLRDPQAVVAFVGQNPSSSVPSLVPLVAATATNGNELRIVDPQADLPVRAPALFSSLAVPTITRPDSLASASLYDGGADVLLLGAGGTEVQLVDTWSASAQSYGVYKTWDLSPVVGAGCQILSMAGLPVPGSSPSGQPPVWPATPGVARVVVGFTGGADGLGGKLVVLDFARNADGSVYLRDRPTVKVVGFAPLDLAASPDRVHVYAATKDLIVDSGGRQARGVAEVDASAADAAAWTVRALDGRGPTGSVAAAILGERTKLSTVDFGLPKLRVYAALDASGCGPTQPIACGIATFDPATGGLADDPAPPPSPIGPKVPNQPYRAPLYLPALPLRVAVGLPAATGSTQCTTPATCPAGVNDQGIPQPLEVVISSVQSQWTTATAGACSGDGYVYIEDLGRFGPVDNTVLLDNTVTRTAVISAVSVPATTAQSGPFVGLYNPPGLGPTPDPGAFPVADSADLVNSIIVWPGFTNYDTWTLVWQGVLPGLNFVRGVLGSLASGEVYLAVQEAVNPLQAPSGSADWVVGAYVGAPDLFIHDGDIAQFFPDADLSGCFTVKNGQVESVYEGTVASILPPDPVNYPGGALKLAYADGSLADCLVKYLEQHLLLAPGTYVPVSASVRASGLVLSSASLGYAGRPVLGERYNLAWQPEDGLSGEALLLARKARRLFYPGGPYTDPYQGGPCPGATACYPGFPEMTDPMQPGPVVGFRPALLCASGGAVAACPDGTAPPRDAYLYFQTQSGMLPLANRPTDVATPTAVIPFDKSVFTDSGSQSLGQVYYSTFTGDTLFMLPPVGIGASKTIH